MKFVKEVDGKEVFMELIDKNTFVLAEREGFKPVEKAKKHNKDKE